MRVEAGPETGVFPLGAALGVDTEVLVCLVSLTEQPQNDSPADGRSRLKDWQQFYQASLARPPRPTVSTYRRRSRGRGGVASHWCHYAFQPPVPPTPP